MILSIETSTDVCSVAIHQQEQLIDSVVSTEAYSHAEKLAPMIDELLKTSKVDKHQLTAIAVSAGPGSYTGLRIGTATAKGLCYALDIPLIAVNTLESMLVSGRDQAQNTWLCPMIDARRMEVYCLLADNHGQIIVPTEAKIIDETSFASYLNDHKISFFGNGAAKCNNTITHANAQFLEHIKPSAIDIGTLANKKYQSGDFADLVYFEPEYLKPYVAIKAKNPLL